MFLDQANASNDPHPVRDLIAEAHHRIANSLTAISGLVQHRALRLAPDDVPMPASVVRQMLFDVRARVDAVARLHRHLSDSGVDEPVDIGAYLHHVSHELVSSLSQRGTVTLHFDCELGCRVSPELALHLGLITVELVTNSLKYAHPAGVAGSITIRCYRRAQTVAVDIADDGVGLPEGFDPNDSGSGLKLVRSLVQQIGGTIDFRSDSLGFRASIEVPARAL
jgi:two-component sensor histidine kinase